MKIDAFTTSSLQLLVSDGNHTNKVLWLIYRLRKESCKHRNICYRYAGTDTIDIHVNMDTKNDGMEMDTLNQ